MKKGHNSAMKSLKEKKKKYGSSYFSHWFQTSEFKILSLTVLDRLQSVTHRCTGKNQYASSTSSKLGAYLGMVGRHTLRKRLRIRSVISVNYHYITVLCPFNLLIRFKCYNTV